MVLRGSLPLAETSLYLGLQHFFFFLTAASFLGIYPGGYILHLGWRISTPFRSHPYGFTKGQIDSSLALFLIPHWAMPFPLPGPQSLLPLLAKEELNGAGHPLWQLHPTSRILLKGQYLTPRAAALMVEIKSRSVD